MIAIVVDYLVKQEDGYIQSWSLVGLLRCDVRLAGER